METYIDKYKRCVKNDKIIVGFKLINLYKKNTINDKFDDILFPF